MIITIGYKEKIAWVSACGDNRIEYKGSFINLKPNKMGK